MSTVPYQGDYLCMLLSYIQAESKRYERFETFIMRKVLSTKIPNLTYTINSSNSVFFLPCLRKLNVRIKRCSAHVRTIVNFLQNTAASGTQLLQQLFECDPSIRYYLEAVVVRVSRVAQSV
jgi:hypothetical protein